MKYKDYDAVIQFDEDDQVLHGRVIDVADVISFHGASVEEVEQAFHEAVDDYLVLCASRGESPDKPFSGRFVVRMDPDLHRKATIAAARANESLNAWVEEAVADRVKSA